MAKSTDDQGTTMKLLKILSVLLDLLFLASSLSHGGQLDDAIRIIALVVASIAVALAFVLIVLLAILLANQRQPPYLQLPGER
jgi:hypothetical protein